MRHLIRGLVDLPVGVLAAFVDHRDGVGDLGDPVLDAFGDGGRGHLEGLPVGDLAQPFGVAGAHQVQLRQRGVRIGQRGVEQHHVVLQQLASQHIVEDLDQVLGFDHGAGVVQFDHQTQRQLGQLPAQFGARAGDPGRAEPAAVGFAEPEADAGHPLGAVPAVRVELADHAVHVDLLVGDRTEDEVLGLGEEFGEALHTAWLQAHHRGVAVVPDDLLAVRAAEQHRTGDQDVVGVGVAVQQRTECGQQHGVRRGSGGTRGRADPFDRVGRQCDGGAL